MTRSGLRTIRRSQDQSLVSKLFTFLYPTFSTTLWVFLTFPHVLDRHHVPHVCGYPRHGGSKQQNASIFFYYILLIKISITKLCTMLKKNIAMLGGLWPLSAPWRYWIRWHGTIHTYSPHAFSFYGGAEQSEREVRRPREEKTEGGGGVIEPGVQRWTYSSGRPWHRWLCSSPVLLP